MIPSTCLRIKCGVRAVKRRAWVRLLPASSIHPVPCSMCDLTHDLRSPCVQFGYANPPCSSVLAVARIPGRTTTV